jgi:hypothetical protein
MLLPSYYQPALKQRLKRTAGTKLSRLQIFIQLLATKWKKCPYMIRRLTYVSDFRQSRWFVWLIPDWYNQRILSVIERKAKCSCSQKAPNALKTVWNFRLLVCGVLLTSPFSFFHYVNQWWTSYHASMSLSKFMSMSVSISVSMSVPMSGPVSLSVFCVHVRASVRPCPCSISAHVLVHVACIYVCKIQETTHLRPPSPFLREVDDAFASWTNRFKCQDRKTILRVWGLPSDDDGSPIFL